MIENNRIIIVDDVENDLYQLRDTFYKKGVGCRSFLYDGFTFPDTPLKGVRFAFFDINLKHANQDADIYATLKEAITKYISYDNGPFVLIFWSKNTDKITGFSQFVNRIDDDFKNKMNPILFEAIDKSEFIEKDNSLEETLDSILSKSIVKCLIGFDEEVLVAATQTLNSIIATIPHGNQWGDSDEFNKNCQYVFSKIAEATYGLTRAKTNPDSAIRESFIPVFASILLQNKKTYWAEFLKPLEEASKSGDLKFPNNYSSTILNTIFHINHCVEYYSKEDRGAVYPLKEEEKGNIFNTIFQVPFNEWFNSIINNPTDETKNSSKIVGIEFSASCDYSQNKGRTKKYILGAMLPIPIKIKRSDYLLEIFDIEYEHTAYKLVVNLNYSFIEPQNASFLEPPLFILRKEIMDMIGNKYANHVSRIGITSF